MKKKKKEENQGFQWTYYRCLTTVVLEDNSISPSSTRQVKIEKKLNEKNTITLFYLFLKQRLILGQELFSPHNQLVLKIKTEITKLSE